MSTSRYTVYAFSPTLNQQIRRFDLTESGDYTLEQANEHAEWFALLNNKNRYLQTEDWQPLVQLEQHGIDTIPGYQG
jgi:hypothetical protein